MQKKMFQALGFALVTFGIFACNPENGLPTTPKVNGPMGSARVMLPAIPENYLSKSAAGTKAIFVLTVSGENMTTIQQSLSLEPGQSDSLIITAIPSGYMRVFSGQLLKVNSTTGDSSITHEGLTSAYVERNQTSNVYLYLSKKGNGSAHICVDIEDWSRDSTCFNSPRPDTIIVPIDSTQVPPDTIITPPDTLIDPLTPPVDTFKTCYNVFQTLKVGKSGDGPKGLINSTGTKSDTVSYTGNFIHGSIAQGQVYRSRPRDMSPNGTWKATLSACTERDLIPVFIS
jgi:hypothetical protein